MSVPENNTIESKDNQYDVEQSYLHFLYEHAMRPCENDLGFQRNYIDMLKEFVDIAREGIERSTNVSTKSSCQRVVDRFDNDMKMIDRVRCRLLIQQKTIDGAREEIGKLISLYK